MQISGEQFKALQADDRMDVLYDNMCGIAESIDKHTAAMNALQKSHEELVKEVRDNMELLTKSPWRMAIPPVSWRYLGLFVLGFTALVKADINSFSQILSILVKTILGG